MDITSALRSIDPAVVSTDVDGNVGLTNANGSAAKATSALESSAEGGTSGYAGSNSSQEFDLDGWVAINAVDGLDQALAIAGGKLEQAAVGGSRNGGDYAKTRATGGFVADQAGSVFSGGGSVNFDTGTTASAGAGSLQDRSVVVDTLPVTVAYPNPAETAQSLEGVVKLDGGQGSLSANGNQWVQMGGSATEYVEGNQEQPSREVPMSPSSAFADVDGSVEVKDNNGRGGKTGFDLNLNTQGSKAS